MTSMVLSQKVPSFDSIPALFAKYQGIYQNMCTSSAETSPKYFKDTHEPKLLYSSGYQAVNKINNQVQCK